MEALASPLQPFFQWLWQTTVIASLVICLILAAQKLLGNRLGPRWSYALWLVLLIRMVIPWAPPSRISLLNLLPSSIRQTQLPPISNITVQGADFHSLVLSEAVKGTTEQQATPSQSIRKATPPKPQTLAKAERLPEPAFLTLRQALSLLWLAGATLVGAYLFVSNFALWRIVKRDRPLVNQSLLELFEGCKAQMGVQTLVALVPSSRIGSPALFGFIRPRLLLPHEMLDTASRDEMRYVFLHELAHLKRHDIYLGWLTSLLQVVHWFNPLVWLAFHRMRSDRELACDALVLARTGQQESQEYGRAIVALLRRFSHSRPLPAMAGILESKSQLKRRIAMITRFKNNSYRWSPAAVVTVLAVACLALPGARKSAATAGDRPASLAGAATRSQQATFRKIRIPHDAFRLRPEAQLSPDGNSIAFVVEGKLWIMPRVGTVGPDYPGVPTLLNTDDIEVSWEGLAWSRDGRWIAFNDKELTRAAERSPNRRMYVVSPDGGKPRETHRNWHGYYVVNYRMSLSPNGRTLAFSSVDANELHIYAIPVEGGVPKRLVEAPAREPVFSPDGKRIAYVADKDLGAGGGGLWVVSADGGVPTLVTDAGCASSPTWSPDGRMIAFLDYKDDKSRRQIYVIPMGEDGEPLGGKITIDCPEGIDSVMRLTGWTPDNKIGAVFVGHPQYGLYTLPATGGIAALVAHGYLNQPRWSPGGKRIICTVDAGKGQDGWIHLGLASISAEGGETTTIPVRADTQIAKLSWGGGNHVSPDGQTIVFAGRRKEEAQWINHIWTLPVEGGEPRQLTNAPAPLTDWYPCWSPDGKAIAFVRSKNDPTTLSGVDTAVFIIPTEGGETKQLTRASDMVIFGYIAWSPDGTWLAYSSSDEDYSPESRTLRIVPAAGGPSRAVGKLGQGLDARVELAWSSDSKRIAFSDLSGKAVKIMSLDDGSVAEIDPHLANTHIHHLDWSRDGERLVFGGRQGGDPEFWMVENFLPQERGE